MEKTNMILILLIYLVSSGFSNQDTALKTGVANVKETKDGSATAKAQKSPENDFLEYFLKIKAIAYDSVYSSKRDFNHINIANDRYTPEGAAIIGAIRSNKLKCKMIIYSYPADIRLPVLEVYDIKGEKINQKQLYDLGFCMEDESNYSTFNLINSNQLVLSNYSNSSLIKTDTICLDSFCK